MPLSISGREQIRRIMDSSATPPPPGIDINTATPARIYDYWLGGHDHFASDRIAALQVTQVAPEAPLLAIENRKFLRRAVRYLADEARVSQFLDIGTGLPTRGNVHEVAQDINPACHIVYSDNDPMVLAHSRALKTGDHVAVIQADLRDPRAIISHPDTRRLLDFGKPLAVLFVAVLHFISDEDDPAAAVTAFRDVLAPGSFLVLSHVAGDVGAGAPAQAAMEYKKSVPDATLRSRAEVLRFFDGFDLIEPGLVQVPRWRPDGPVPDGADKVWLVGAVGRKSG
jgi:SAM-dependent methyltransferase